MYIKDLKKNHNFLDKLLLFADFETIVHNDQHKVICFSLFKIGSSPKANIISKSFEDIDEESNTLLSSFLENIFQYENAIIYFHNGSKFDFIFLLNYLSQYPDKYEIDLLSRDNCLYNLTIKHGDKIIELRDTFHLLPLSLKKIAATINLDKEEFDVKNIELLNLKDANYREKLIKYCIKDSILLHDVFKAYRYKMHEMFNLDIVKCYTIASFSMKCFRLNYYDYENTKIYIPNENADSFIRRAYYGGKTEVYKPHLIKGHHYDVNSLYPHAMFKYEYPLERGEFISINAKLDFIEHIGFYQVDVVTPKNLYIPFLVYKEPSGKLISPLGKFKGLYFSEEIKHAIKLGYTFYCSKAYIFKKKGYIFKNFVEDIYQKRLEGNVTMNTICKLLLNSLYGKFGIKQEKTMTQIGNNNDLTKILLTRKDVRYHAIHNRYLIRYSSKLDMSTLQQRLDEKLISENTFQNLLLLNQNTFIDIIKNQGAIQIAAAVTGYARIEMDYYLRKYSDNLYYSDTDSLFLSTKAQDEDVSKTELGKLRYEGEIEEGYFIHPKVYSYKSKENSVSKIAGFPNNQIPETLIEELYNNPNKEEITYKNPFLRIFNQLTIYSKNKTIRLNETLHKRNKVFENNKWVDTSAIIKK
jgi:hypothetical protein